MVTIEDAVVEKEEDDTMIVEVEVVGDTTKIGSKWPRLPPRFQVRTSEALPQARVCHCSRKSIH